MLENTLERWAETALKRRLGSTPLQIRLWNGRTFRLSPKPRVTLHIPHALALRHLIRPSFLSLGQAYVEGDIHIEGSASDAMQVVESLSTSSHFSPTHLRRWKPKPHNRKLDADAIQFHYDVSNDFYRLWLDRNLVYSCGYFRTPHDSLEQAQEQKMDHICKKLLLRKGERFLDIGCGWGGLLIWAAKHYGVHATGITLSRNQLKFARERIRKEKLEGRCEVLLQDYRDLDPKRPFDKIASVGMFEHVGLENLRGYFATIHGLLKDGGLVLNHGICSSEVDPVYVAGDAGDFIDRYVFPFHELPHVSFAIREMAHEKLEPTDIESLRPHYALTLRHWLNRLESKQLAAEKQVGDRRFRIWRAYLAGSALAFERGWVTIYQMLAAKTSLQHSWPLPWTRDHVYAEKHRWPPIPTFKSLPV